MPRPRYETAEDRQAQTDIATVLALLWHMDPILQRGDRHWDYVMMWGSSPRYRVEIKDRSRDTNGKTPYHGYKKLMISSQKWDGLIAVDSDEVRSVVVVRWPDRSLWGIRVDGSDEFERKSDTGRFDRGDAFDIEVNVFIPMTEMTRLV